MRKGTTALYLLTIFCFISSCSIYQSSDRKKFEDDNKVAAANLQVSYCSDSSAAPSAQRSRVIDATYRTDGTMQSQLWEFEADGVIFYEVDYLNGVFCRYD